MTRIDHPGLVLAGEEMMVRNSERNTFARCRMRWRWAYRDFLTPRNVKPALRFGDLVHQALAVYYKPSRVLTKVVRGPHPTDTFVKLYDAQLEEYTEFGMKTEEDEWSNARDLGVAMLDNYIAEYGKDDRYVVVKPEVPGEVDLYDGDTYVCTFVFQFDAVIYDRQTGKYGLFEHKTAKRISTAHLSMDEQAGSYFAVGPVFFGAKGLPELDFVLYNFLRKGFTDDRPENEKGQKLNKPTKNALFAELAQWEDKLPPKSTKVDDLVVMLGNHGVDAAQLGEVSKTQPSPLFHRELVRRGAASSQTVIDRIVDQALEMMMVDAGMLPPLKTITSDCNWQCDFFDMCELHERGADWEEYRNLEMTTWDPYAAHYEGGTDEKPEAT